MRSRLLLIPLAGLIAIEAHELPLILAFDTARAAYDQAAKDGDVRALYQAIDDMDEAYCAKWTTRYLKTPCP